MENISPDELAFELLHQCLRGNTHSSELLGALLRMALSRDPDTARRSSSALFTTVVERLADQFEPCLSDSYAALFSDVISRVIPSLTAADLLNRFRRIRMTSPFGGDASRVDHVFVLSRVTLGADVAITSLCLDAAKQRFPAARIHFAGPRKNWELFAGDSRIEHLHIPYLREGTLRARLEVYPLLRETLGVPDSIVIDPDSRLTQLGLLPVGREDDYYFFESRSFGDYGEESLPELTRTWLQQTFNTPYVSAWIAPVEEGPEAGITVSLGVGDNHSKRIGGSFERDLLQELSTHGLPVLVDRGGNDEESARVEAACEGLPNVRTFSGSFAAFANSIQESRLFVGYDSAGGHVAAACATPLVSIFAGHGGPRMFYRWQPDGDGPRQIIRVESQEPAAVLDQATESIRTLLDE